MDCDDVILLLARDQTLTGAEEEVLHVHLEGCDACSELARDDRDEASWRWIARMPDDAFDDPDSLALPIVDPIVFAAGEQIAAGGMGKITRARDRRLGREVAIKEMLEPDLRARFEREATITARLQHPAIVPIYEAGTWPNGGAFYTMRLVSGGTLANAIDKAEGLTGRLALLPHVIAVTEALAYAHSRRIIHRDLKPHNVLVGEFGEAVVIDWGLAKELDRADPASSRVMGALPALTLAGAVVGTPCFMAPEQARGEELDERADVFALGSILYNVLAGQPPYWDQKRDTAQQLIDAVLARSPTPIATYAADAPEDLRAVVERAMQREPADRFASAKEMAEELRRFQAGQLLVSRQYGIRDLLVRWIARHKAAVGVGTFAAVALAVVAVIAVVNITRSRNAERDARVLSELSQADSTRSVAALLEEQGRSELVGGHRDRALAYLAEAYSRGRDTPALRHLLAEATRDLDLLVATLHTPAGEKPRFSELAFLPDGRLAVWSFGIANNARLELVTDGITKQHFELGDAVHGKFSPDGKRLVTSTDQKPSIVWDVSTGAQLWQVAGNVDSVSFDPSSSYVALIQGHAGATVYELDTGKKVLDMPAKYAVNVVAFDASGRIIVAIGDDGLCTFFAAEPKSPEYSVIPFGKTGLQLVDAAFLASKTDDRVLMTTKEREVLLWTLEKPFRSIGGHRATITAIAASTAHRLFASADASGEVKLWGYDGNLLGETTDSKQAVRGLAFSHDGSMLVGFGDDARSFVWNTALGLRGELLAPGDEFESIDTVAIAADDSRIATVNSTGDRVRVWRPPNANLVAHLTGVALAVADHVAVTTHAGKLTVTDLATGHVVKQFEVRHNPAKRREALQDLDRERLIVTPDGRRALTFARTGAAVYELATGKLVADIIHDADNNGDSTTWELSANGRYVVECGDRVIAVHDLQTDKIVITAPTESTGRSGEISADGSRFVVADATPHAWQLPSGTPIAMPPLALKVTKIPHGSGNVVITPSVSDLVISPTGDRMIVLGLPAPLVIDAAGRTVASLELATLDRDVLTARFSGDGKRLVTQVQDLAAVWNLGTGEVMFTIPDTADRAVAMTADAERIITGSNDGTIRIWDATGRLLETIHAHRAAIAALYVSRDNTRLVAQGDDDETTFWDIHLEQRSPAEIAAVAAAATPWHVVGGTLVLRKSK